MRVNDGSRNLAEPLVCLAGWQSLLRNFLSERRTVDELHGHVETTLVHALKQWARLQQADDVRVAEIAQKCRLALDPFHGIGLIGWRDLDGGRRLIHLAHGPPDDTGSPLPRHAEDAPTGD